jgi:hypothetical protein
VLNFVAVCVTLIAGAIPGPQAGNLDAGRVYGSEAPYGNAASSEVLEPPKGYSLFFVQTVGRHGSRTSIPSEESDRILQLWEQAEKADALTETGEDLKADIEKFKADEEELGAGQLTSLGKNELHGLGRRTADNYANFFTRAQDDGDKIAFVTSNMKRTKDSAAAMKSAIQERNPDLKIAKDAVSNRTLRLNGKASAIGRDHIRRLRKVQDVKVAANNILANIFQPVFIETRIKDPVGAALDMYRLFQRGPGMRPHTEVTFTEYVDSADAEVLSDEQAGEKLYRYGPGVRDETNTYSVARPLLNDFMKRLQKRVDGGKIAAVFRHSHGETVMPFTALTQLRSANKPEPKGGLYTEGSNPWRSYKSGAIAGSVEWAAYRNKRGKVLLSLRFNEEPSRFSKACKPTEPDGPFYTLPEIKRCIYSTAGFEE